MNAPQAGDVLGELHIESVILQGGESRIIGRCSCGGRFSIAVRNLRNRKHLMCNGCVRRLPPVNAGHTFLCSRCRSPEHTAATCKERGKPRWCDDCGGMPHRVTGKICAGCGARHKSEPPPSLHTDGRGQWGWV